LKYDDVVNQQRKVIFALRSEIIGSDDVSAKVKNFVSQINQELVEDCIPKNSYFEQWEIGLLEKEVFRIYGTKFDLKAQASKDGVSESEILNFIEGNIAAIFASKEKLHTAAIMRKIEKQIFLITLDSEWKDHLLSLDKLRHGINLRAYAQKDPLIEYKRDALTLFEEMMLRIEEQLVSRLAHVQINVESDESGVNPEINLLAQAPKQRMFETRNDPAGSGFIPVQSEAKPARFAVSSMPLKSNVSPAERNPRDPSSWGNVGRNSSNVMEFRSSSKICCELKCQKSEFWPMNLRLKTRAKACISWSNSSLKFITR
jgi:preprotein translocase subunit SecA